MFLGALNFSVGLRTTLCRVRGVVLACIIAAPAVHAAVRPTILLDIAYADRSPKQRLDLYLPAQTNGPAPLVIWMHGGSFTTGDKASMPYRYTRPPPTPTGPNGPYQIQVPDVSTLTSKGYAVASLNYRLEGDAFPAIQDAKLAVRFLRANAARYSIDPSRFGFWGNSAGGYAATVLGLTGDQHNIYEEDATLPNAGISSAIQAVVSWYGGPFGSVSSYLSAATTIPPFRIAYGSVDSASEIDSAQQLHQALVGRGVPSTFVLLPGAGHEDPAFMATEMAPTIAFLDNVLKPPNQSGLATFYPDLAYGTASVLQRVDLFLPARESGPAPVVIWFHGDDFKNGNKANMPGSFPARTGDFGAFLSPDVAALNARGCAVVGANYRLGGTPAGGALWAVQDGKAVVRFLRANASAYNLDPARIAVWGCSSGGYVAAMLALTGDRPTAFDDPAFGNADVSSSVQACVVWFGAYEGLAPDLTLMNYISIGKKLPPFRIANGSSDPVILPAQALRLHDALRAVGGESSLTILSSATHEDPAFTSMLMTPTIDFLAASLSAVTPIFTVQPQGHTSAAGSSVMLDSNAQGGGLSYQWKKNGADLIGAVSSQLLLANVQAGDTGSYTVTATNSAGTVTSSPAPLAVVVTGNPGHLVNASVRIVSGTDVNTLFVGFVLGGAGTGGSTPLLIRGIGPTLSLFGVPNVMPDPLLEIFPGGGTAPIATNDNWGGDPTVLTLGDAVGAFPLTDTSSKDAALATSLGGGVYSAKVYGKNNTSGTVLAEVYDATPGGFNGGRPRLINLSARATMSNDNPLIAGFAIGGTTAVTVMIRAIGPELAKYVGPQAMSDPKLELYVHQSGNAQLLLTGDNWGGNELITTTGNRVGAFSLSDPTSKDAVLLVTLEPGVYSAKVLGANNASGIALVEVYEIP